jgi:metal-responsive CopG/Arc/MetJ family transcriptional regulator
MPFSLRLDDDTEERIDRLARERGTSRAAVVREAVARYAEEADGSVALVERLKPFIGVIGSGRSDLSSQTGRRFTALVKASRSGRARRPR